MQSCFTSLSAQNDNVLIAQSRNVLLTRSGWGGGIRNTSHDPTDRDRLMRSEESQEGADHPRQAAEEIGQTERHIRRLLVKLNREGDQAVVHGRRGKRSNRKVEREEPGQGGGDFGTKEVSRVRSHAGQRVSEQAPPDHSQSRNGAGVDDRSHSSGEPRKQKVEKVHAWRQRRARCGRAGAVGHQRARMVGRARTESCT